MLGRIRCKNRMEWLAEREQRGIGASEAAAIAGDSKWTTVTELWKIKTGQRQAPDISGSADVKRGIRMEGAIRGMFAARHPELRVYHHPYDILFQKERPWLFATLDGEVLVRETGEMGILEIKTAEPRGRTAWEEWNDKIPAQYYDQNLHQHLATGYRKIWLVVGLFAMNGDIIYREFERSADEGFALDASWLLAKEEQFMDCVNRKIVPSVSIKL